MLTWWLTSPRKTMAVDNTLIVAGIVAGTSLVTLFLNNWNTLKIKRIDAEQKLNEHKLSIRSVYITKKIEAGQIFVGENNILINNAFLIKRYLTHFKHYDDDTNAIMSDFKMYSDKILELRLNKDKYTHLYFDLNALFSKAGIRIDKLNNLIPKVEPGNPRCENDNYSENLDEAIECANELANVYYEMNKNVREELAKYDIV